MSVGVKKETGRCVFFFFGLKKKTGWCFFFFSVGNTREHSRRGWWRGSIDWSTVGSEVADTPFVRGVFCLFFAIPGGH